jgi:hypothetical protein
MDLREKVLYHQIHPLKLATDISVTPLFLYYLWEHRTVTALLIGFVPPLVVSRSQESVQKHRDIGQHSARTAARFLPGPSGQRDAAHHGTSHLGAEDRRDYFNHLEERGGLQRQPIRSASSLSVWNRLSFSGIFPEVVVSRVLLWEPVFPFPGVVERCDARSSASEKQSREGSSQGHGPEPRNRADRGGRKPSITANGEFQANEGHPQKGRPSFHFYRLHRSLTGGFFAAGFFTRRMLSTTPLLSGRSVEQAHFFQENNIALVAF